MLMLIEQSCSNDTKAEKEKKNKGENGSCIFKMFVIKNLTIAVFSDSFFSVSFAPLPIQT